MRIAPVEDAPVTARAHRAPRMAATITRRALVNYRVEPAVAQSLLPDGLRPRLIDGSAVAGVCLIHLTALRPEWFAPAVGHESRNAAHRIAVEWNDSTGRHTGVYIPRRHSSSRLVRAAGGRIFPGVHARATVGFHDTPESVRAQVDADDLRVRFAARRGPGIPFRSDLFATLDESSEFFRHDAIGWSPTRSGTLEGVKLDIDAWRVEPLAVTTVESSLFDALPRDTVAFDHALFIRDVPARWSGATAPTP